MTSESKFESNDSLLAQAADWLVRLQDENLSAEDLSAWEEWLSESAHEQAFSDMERLWQQCGEIGEISLPDAAEAAADQYDGTVPVNDWLEETLRRRESGASNRASGAKWQWIGVAATVVLVSALALFRLADEAPVESPIYETGIAQHREVDLPDGSRITLGASSRVVVSYHPATREVVLERGEALFDVIPDPNRPFTVNAGFGAITAVGTAFNVQYGPERVVVTVTEGTIEVTSLPGHRDLDSQSDPAAQTVARVDVGKRISYDARGALGSIETADLEIATAWREGKLSYKDERLRFVVADVNRYSRREIVLADEHIGDLVFTGTVLGDHTDEWVRGLEDVFPVRLIDTPQGRIVVVASR